MVCSDLWFRTCQLIQKCGLTDTRETDQGDGCITCLLDVETLGVPFGWFSLLILLLEAGDLRFELTDMPFCGLVVFRLGDLIFELSYLILNCQRLPPWHMHICALFKGNADNGLGLVFGTTIEGEDHCPLFPSIIWNRSHQNRFIGIHGSQRSHMKYRIASICQTT